MAKFTLDPVVALSLSVTASRGVYALLLGSGLSRAASIPTGWDITLDLVRQVAKAKNEDCGDDPQKWCVDTFGVEPDYSALLNELGGTVEERHQLLRKYFEPTEDEREQGWKQPTKAHHAIARLVAQGYIKIILTTNFDRLLEKALEDAGVSPTVISTTDAIAGSLPLVHQRCCIIKIHGDYLDTRIKNTPTELASYDGAIDKLLDRVFDEFGLIVCGWSGVWDTALRNAIDRCPSRRFSTYWTYISDPDKKAVELIDRRSASLIRIKDADTFFVDLADKVEAIDASAQSHPLSTIAAVASLKKFVAEDRYNIRLRDLLFDEIQRANSARDVENRTLLSKHLKDSDISGIWQRYREMYATANELFAHGYYWSREQTDEFFLSALQQVCNFPPIVSGPQLNDGFLHYPCIFSTYVSGIAALAKGNYKLLSRTFRRLTMKLLLVSGEKEAVLTALNWSHIISFAETLSTEKKFFPISEHLYLAVRPVFQSLVPHDGEFEDLFDRYEYLQSLVYYDLRSGATDLFKWAPMGRFGWRGRHQRHGIIETVKQEIDLQGEQWSPLVGGLFPSVERLNAVKKGVAESLSRRNIY